MLRKCAWMLLNYPAASAVGEAILQHCAPLRANSEMTAVKEVYNHVQECITNVDKDMSLYLFGSSAVYGFREPKSDVDLAALSSADIKANDCNDAVTEVAKGIQGDFLSKLANELSQRHLSWNVDLVRRTRVPVLRVKANEAAVDFDITANRCNGVRNSALLRSYFKQALPARLLSVAIKSWSKRAGVNASIETGFLTSYGFNIMVVYYLLQRRIVSFVPPESCKVESITPLPEELPINWDEPNLAKEIGEMVNDWLQFYLDEYHPDREVITLSRDSATTKEQLEWTRQAEDLARIRGEKVHYCWCIEDPYEVNLNVGRKITSFKLMLLRKHLERAAETGLLLLTPPPSSSSSSSLSSSESLS